MKFLHVADLHIGSNRSIPGFLERQEDVYDQIFESAKSLGVDAVVVAGDIWHQKLHPPRERDLFMKKLLQYNHYGFKIILIAGNHDYLEPGLTHLQHITFQADLGRLNNVVSADTTIKFYQMGDQIFLLMPHATFRHKEFNQEVRSYVKALQESSFEVPFKGIIVVAHFAVKNSDADVSSAAGKSFRMPDGVEIDDTLPITYIALGDLHVQQRVCSCCYYSGSPIQTRWGEAPNKGGLLVDTDSPDDPKFVPFESKRMLTFYEAPEKWPEDAFVRLITETEPPDNLPSNALVVVKPKKYVATTPEGEEVPEESANLLEDLEAYLTSRGCPDEYLEIASQEAQEIAREQGVSLPESI